MFVSFDREVTPVWFKLVFAYGGIDVLEMTDTTTADYYYYLL